MIDRTTYGIKREKVHIFVVRLLCCSDLIHHFYSYVPMFGEFEYDPTRQFGSVSVEEQLDALGRAVVAGKVGNVAL